MAKYHGMIGFSEEYESVPGIVSERITEREFFGEVLDNRFTIRDSSETPNDELTLNKRISVIANTYAIENMHLMRYATYMGVKWKITSIDPQYPRLILSMGGVYNAH